MREAESRRSITSLCASLLLTLLHYRVSTDYDPSALFYGNGNEVQQVLAYNSSYTSIEGDRGTKGLKRDCPPQEGMVDTYASLVYTSEEKKTSTWCERAVTILC